jgi:hypothetical protein
LDKANVLHRLATAAGGALRGNVFVRRPSSFVAAVYSAALPRTGPGCMPSPVRPGQAGTVPRSARGACVILSRIGQRLCASATWPPAQLPKEPAVSVGRVPDLTPAHAAVLALLDWLPEDVEPDAALVADLLGVLETEATRLLDELEAAGVRRERDRASAVARSLGARRRSALSVRRMVIRADATTASADR